ncbi:MAG: hypothetical protein ACTHKC_07680 [Candidatus Nitrosocosmicus sp.]
MSIIYLAENHENLENKIYKVPKKIEKEINSLALKSFNIKIDKVTSEQEYYFYS